MQFDTGIEGGMVVTRAGRARLNVYVRDGRVDAVTAERLAATSTIDATGLLVLPGFVDTHVHLMDPGPSEREDFPTGTAAAAAAGVTTIIEHTHGHPIRTLDDLHDKSAYLQGRSNVDYGLAAHVWPDAIGNLPGLWAAGVAFFKIFTCTTHGVPGLNAAALLDTFTTLARAGAATLVHCEDESLTEAAEQRLRAAGRDDPGVIVEWRSREAETVAVSVVTALLRSTGAHAAIAHVSSPRVADLVAAAKRDGADVVAEACPQYFLLREAEIHEHGAFRKFTPPARAQIDDDELTMWKLLRAGVFNHVSSDHAPATREQKNEGSIWDVHFGLPGIDTTGPMLIDAALRGRLSLEDVVDRYAWRPATWYGLTPRKGSLDPGADADIVLVDPTAERTLSDGDVLSKAGWTPYAGRQLRGRITQVLRRGTVIATDGEPSRDLAGEFLPGGGHRRAA